jgi:23S rRNA (cytidine1920-2'-O)/16S rRNA (cytidine1409-2'-O)-methyltransferase
MRAGSAPCDHRERRYVSRGGLKLEAALADFDVDPAGTVCADLGSNVGGFVQCLLRHGAAKVYSIDTGYGVLDYQLRKDDRVVVMERTNAMHVDLLEPIGLVTIDVGWTRQRHIVPAALKMLGPDGDILSLVKPHYEAPRAWLRRGVLTEDRLPAVVDEVVAELPTLGAALVSRTDSPIVGQAGNREVWLHLRRAEGAD